MPKNWLRNVFVTLAVVGMGLYLVVTRPTDPLNVVHDARDTWFGAFHVHSELSHDSTLSLDEITHAAKDAGLDFVVLTDHNKLLEHSESRNGVLVIPGFELSTSFGHLVGIGIPTVPDEVERKRSSVVAELRQQGFTVIAHPSDLKRPWTQQPWRADGVEIASFSSQARQATQPWFLGLLADLPVFFFRPLRVLRQFYDYDSPTIDAWMKDPNLLGLCASDAHGWIDLSLNLQSWITAIPRATVPTLSADHILSAMSVGRYDCLAGLFGRPVPQWYLRQQSDGSLQVSLAVPGAPFPMKTSLYQDGAPVSEGPSGLFTIIKKNDSLLYGELWTNTPKTYGGIKQIPIVYSRRALHCLKEDSCSL